MARGIVIFGSAGSGKTTLGRMTAQALSFPYFDIDDYIWRRDTPQPFTVMYSRQEKISRLMADISQGPHFVMAGSMDSFHAPFDPLFDLAVHLTANAELRVARVHQRAKERYGDRVEPGGDMYRDHMRFLENVARYDQGDASPSLAVHSAWADSLACPVLRLDGGDPLQANLEAILRAYRALPGGPA